MKRALLFSLTLLASTVFTSASYADAALKSRTFHFGTHPARTNVTFVSEADLETIHGVSHQMSGSIAMDATGAKGRGTLQVPVNSMRTGIAKRDEHLRSATWLDAARFPWIRLDLTEVTRDQGGKTWSWKGKLTVKGVAKAIQGQARVRVIPDALGKQLGPGSWVRVRTAFDVKLSDHGMKIPQQVGSKVSPVWKVRVDLYGTTTVR